MTSFTARGTGWSGVVLVAVAAAVAVAVTLVLQPAVEPRALASPVSSIELEERLDALAQRLDRIETDLRTTTLQSEAPAADERRAVEGEGAAGLASRLDRLEQELHALAEAGAATPGAVPPARTTRNEERDPAAEARETEGHRHTILDPAAAQDAKLAAWGALRFRENGWNDAVVHEMVRIGLTASDPEVRADVWRQADGRSTHDAMVPALLQALQSDDEADVREEAAETLQNYAGRPHVQQALEYARANDPSEGVRSYAARSLERGRR